MFQWDIPPALSNPHQKIKGFVKSGNIFSSKLDLLGCAFLESGIQVSQVTKLLFHSLVSSNFYAGNDINPRWESFRLSAM
jgi:hypothetical protein